MAQLDGLLKSTSSKQKDPNTSLKNEAKRFEEIMVIIKKHNILKDGLTPEGLKHLLEDMGPTYIKIGQIMSSRTDILPVEYCQALEELRSRVDPLPLEVMEAVVEEELGKPIGEVFESFGDKLLGSASIGQVYSAVLKGGQKVVVKVQRPGIYDQMMQDFALLETVANMMKKAPMNNTIDFHMLVEELKNTTKDELNYLVEAHNTDRFYKNAEKLKYATCPKIYLDLTTERIETMEFVDGFSIGDVEKLDELGYDRDEITLKLMDHFVKQVVDDGFFHADPHQGNICISGSRIVWIDMGMMGTITSRERHLMRNAITAISEKNPDLMVNVVLSLGDCHSEIDRAELAEDVDSVMERYLSMDIAEMDLAAILGEVIKLASKYDISMPTGFSMLARSIITIEGVVAKLGSRYSVTELLSGHVIRQTIENYDVKKDIIMTGKQAADAARKALTIPSLASEALKTYTRGQSKVSIELVGLDKLFKQIEILVSQLIAALMVVALLIASSLICMADMAPKIWGIPLIGCLGYIAAIVMGALLFIAMVKRRKK